MDNEAAVQQHQGLVQIYTGDGKGKTTAALGLALRAAGYGMRTYIGQFLKGRDYGELESVQRLSPEITIEQYGLNDWVHVDRVTPEQRQAAQDGLARAREALLSGEYDIVVLDEANVALYFGVLTEEEVLAFIDSRPPHVELILTGRRAPQAIIERADLVTEMREVRHPFHSGVPARRGIEF
jgi:cob(I)alamin adenosyltransferase